MPDVTYYFQNDYIEKYMQGEPAEGAEVLFLLMKNEKRLRDMLPEDFWPVGVTGTVTEIDSEDHSVSIHTGIDIRIECGSDAAGRRNFGRSLYAQGRDRGSGRGKPRESFPEVQTALLQYVGSFQWGIVARNYILRWKTMEEMAAAFSYQLNITEEEKYRIVAADRISERYQRIKEAVYEFIEVSKVSADAEKAQTESNEKLYREEAIKKQIAILQKELDDMHPESVTDVRKFEMKIRDSGMNETARREAEKVLKPHEAGGGKQPRVRNALRLSGFCDGSVLEKGRGSLY